MTAKNALVLRAVKNTLTFIGEKEWVGGFYPSQNELLFDQTAKYLYDLNESHESMLGMSNEIVVKSNDLRYLVGANYEHMTINQCLNVLQPQLVAVA